MHYTLDADDVSRYMGPHCGVWTLECIYTDRLQYYKRLYNLQSNLVFQG